MKSPRLRGMTDLERARLRLFQARRGAERCLQNLDSKELSADGRFSKRMLQCIIAATEPMEVDNADLPAAISMMKYITTVTGEIQGALN